MISSPILFLALDPNYNRNEAKEKADKTKVDDKGLYAMSENEWRAKHDIQGGIIYHEVQGSKYGYVRFLFMPAFLSYFNNFLIILTYNF